MYAQCPECQSVFTLDAATLAQAHGCVGCGQCGATFDTMATLTDSLPSEPSAQLEINHPSPEPPVLMHRATSPVTESSLDDALPAAPDAGQQVISAPSQEATSSQPNTTGEIDDPATSDEVALHGARHADRRVEQDCAAEQNVDELLDDPDSSASGEPWIQWANAPAAADNAKQQQANDDMSQEADDPAALSTLDRELAELDRVERDSPETDPPPDIASPNAPSFVRGRAPPMGTPMKRRLAVACTALAVILLLQLGYAERASLVRTAVGGSIVRALCGSLDCLGQYHDLDQISLLSRDVRKHPSVDDALIISATLHNAAEFTQPYPVVVITLSDLDDNRVAMRRFRPVEYLPDPELREAGLEPGASTALVFEVRDPGRRAVAFEFSFM